MYQIAFYQDQQGRQPVAEYLDDLRNHSDHNKDSRINFNKISLYLEVLERKGTRAGLPYEKKTPKTPKRELEKAKINYIDFLERV